MKRTSDYVEGQQAVVNLDRLVSAVLKVPHSELVRRETEYTRRSLQNPHRRGPKRKQPEDDNLVLRTRDPSSTSFDWVKERHECSPVAAFERLLSQIEEDIRIRNKQLNLTIEPFQLVRERSIAKVFRKGANQEHIVSFAQTDTGISVTSETDSNGPNLKGTVTFDDDGNCVLKSGKKQFQFWQFRKAALEWLLFEAGY